MIYRILALAQYMTATLLRSFAGIFYIIVSLIFCYLFFLQQRSPDVDYYVIVIGAFGAVVTFLVALSVAARAYRAENAAWVVRLPSRVEYLAAVLVSSLLYGLFLQGIVALLALRAGPELTLARIIEIPPIWLSVNLLAAVLALHASDLVTAGWTRVYVYGALLLLLFSQSGAAALTGWVGRQLSTASNALLRQGIVSLGNVARSASNWLQVSGADLMDQLLGLIFWPIRALTDGAIAGYFSNTQALAPAFLLLYATILFLLAADIFATKDLYLTE